MPNDKNITQKQLPEAAKRALAEAEERREAQRLQHEALEQARQNETGGPKADKDPARYGDWEKKGIAYDF